eukprot:6474166-Amphidinium_carterae.1
MAKVKTKPLTVQGLFLKDNLLGRTSEPSKRNLQLEMGQFSSPGAGTSSWDAVINTQGLILPTPPPNLRRVGVSS